MLVQRKKLPRILLLTRKYPPVHSGAGRQLQTLARFLYKRFKLNSIILTGRSNDTSASENEPGIRIKRYASTLPGVTGWLRFGTTTLWYLWQYRKDFDILHVKGIMHDYLFPIFFARILRKKIIAEMTGYQFDNPTAVRRKKFGSLLLRTFAHCSAIVSLSTLLEEDVLKTNEFSRCISRRIPNGVDLQKYYPSKNNYKKISVRHQLGFFLKKTIVIFVGRIRYSKGLDVLLNVWKTIDEAVRKRAELLLVGPYKANDPFFIQIKKELSNDHRLAKIKLLGKRNDLDVIYRAADIFILPSRSEGLPNTVLEAMASGLPVVVSLLKGVTTDIVTHHEDGIVVKGYDAKDYVEWLEKLIMDPKMRVNMGKKARVKISRYFSIEQRAEKFMELYTDLLNHRTQ